MNESATIRNAGQQNGSPLLTGGFRFESYLRSLLYFQALVNLEGLLNAPAGLDAAGGLHVEIRRTPYTD